MLPQNGPMRARLFFSTINQSRRCHLFPKNCYTARQSSCEIREHLLGTKLANERTAIYPYRKSTNQRPAVFYVKLSYAAITYYYQKNCEIKKITLLGFVYVSVVLVRRFGNATSNQSLACKSRICLISRIRILGLCLHFLQMIVIFSF